MEDGERFAPEPLPTKEPIAKLVVDSFATDPETGEIRDDFRFGSIRFQPVEGTAVHGNTCSCKANIAAFDLG